MYIYIYMILKSKILKIRWDKRFDWKKNISIVIDTRGTRASFEKQGLFPFSVIRYSARFENGIYTDRGWFEWRRQKSVSKESSRLVSLQNKINRRVEWPALFYCYAILRRRISIEINPLHPPIVRFCRVIGIVLSAPFDPEQTESFVCRKNFR